MNFNFNVWRSSRHQVKIFVLTNSTVLTEINYIKSNLKVYFWTRLRVGFLFTFCLIVCKILEIKRPLIYCTINWCKLFDAWFYSNNHDMLSQNCGYNIQYLIIIANGKTENMKLFLNLMSSIMGLPLVFCNGKKTVTTYTQ